MIILAVTGHRSKDCESEEIVRLKSRLGMERLRPEVVIVGMANGMDLWAADEARLLGIDVWAAKPWTGHGPVDGDEALYTSIIDYASTIINVVEKQDFPGNWCYHKRNEWMVDHATHIMAYLRKEYGGTFQTVQYARGKKPIRNIWDDPPF